MDQPGSSAGPPDPPGELRTNWIEVKGRPSPDQGGGSAFPLPSSKFPTFLLLKLKTVQERQQTPKRSLKEPEALRNLRLLQGGKRLRRFEVFGGS